MSLCDVCMEIFVFEIERFETSCSSFCSVNIAAGFGACIFPVMLQFVIESVSVCVSPISPLVLFP